MAPDPGLVRRYHDDTKHHFHQFARSLGYLDWASQPSPFRSFAGAATFPLSPAPRAHAAAPEAALVGDVLRHALGLSAWKRFRDSRWSLRVNPSSGNLHPTEAYALTGPIPGLADAPSVFHYAADRHALECRCVFDAAGWRLGNAAWLVAFTSIHWRESWKYGERAFRYCQHDLGHAIAALRLAAALVGWLAALLPEWPQRDLAAVTGVDRDEDYVEAEREEPACLLLLTPDDGRTAGICDAELRSPEGRDGLVRAVRSGRWSGRASQLSEDHVQWSLIDEIARATQDPGRVPSRPISPPRPPTRLPIDPMTRRSDARALILRRRSAVALDGRSSMSAARFFSMLARVLPGPQVPWDALWWTPRIHLALFVHRVEGLAPGLYCLPRDPAVADRLKPAMHQQFLWEQIGDGPLFCLARGDCRSLAARLSCGQDIAGDGFFSLGMLADFDRSLEEQGPSFYRHLFWESGVVGQVLYLDAEAAGAGATGIGCFFDDPVHDTLGLKGHAFQSLYHFTVGMPVDDMRLTTEPGYEWERAKGKGTPSSSESREASDE